jgi:hypothetical protein
MIYVLLLLVLDLLLSYKKFNNIIRSIIKTVIVGIIVFINIKLKLNYSISASLMLLTSIMNIYLFKDDLEKYFISGKGLLFLYSGLDFLNLKFFSQTMILIACNLYMLVMYVLKEDKISRIVNFILLLAIMIIEEVFALKGVLYSIFNLILFFVDFYILYTSTKNSKFYNILFILLFIYGIINMVLLLSSKYIIVLFIIYAFFIAITRKNKVIFITSLLGFLFTSMYYFIFTIDNYNIVYILSVIMTFISFLILYKVLLKKYHE